MLNNDKQRLCRQQWIDYHFKNPRYTSWEADNELYKERWGFFLYRTIDILMVETGFTATLSFLNNHNSYQANNEQTQNEQF